MALEREAEILQVIAGEGESAGLAMALSKLDELPLRERRDNLHLLGLVQPSAALDWLEARIESPVVEGWGITAALLGIRWDRITAWLARGRPHSLAALDALVAYAWPDARRSPLERAVQPLLPDPPSLEEMRRIIAAAVAVDQAHRVVVTVNTILQLAPAILRGGLPTGTSVRMIYERAVAAERARRARWFEKRARLERRAAPSATAGIRPAVQQLIDLGSFPAESDAVEEELDHIRQLLDSIEPPLTRDEATALLGSFGPDSTFGLAWSLLHLIETTPGGAPIAHEPAAGANEWIQFLWDRAHR